MPHHFPYSERCTASLHHVCVNQTPLNRQVPLQLKSSRPFVRLHCSPCSDHCTQARRALSPHGWQGKKSEERQGCLAPECLPVMARRSVDRHEPVLPKQFWKNPVSIVQNGDFSHEQPGSCLNVPLCLTPHPHRNTHTPPPKGGRYLCVIVCVYVCVCVSDA